jgi:hypothetical protein
VIRRGAGSGPRGLVRAILIATAVSMVASGAVAAAVDGASEGTIDGRVLISPLALTLVISPPTIHVGDLASALVTASNQGVAPLGRISVRLRAASGLIVRGRQPQTILSLAPGGNGFVSWSLCGRTPGAYVVFAEASVGSLVVDSPARLVTVLAGPGKCPGLGPKGR